MPKSVAEKMSTPAKPEVKLIKRPISASFPAGEMLIATPRVIDKAVRSIKKGKVISVLDLRERLAKQFEADYTCPLTTGIFLRIVAENAEFERSRGAQRVAPYWRVVQKDGSLNPKFPGGVNAQARKLRAEGVKVVTKGAKLKVAI